MAIVVLISSLMVVLKCNVELTRFVGDRFHQGSRSFMAAAHEQSAHCCMVTFTRRPFFWERLSVQAEEWISARLRPLIVWKVACFSIISDRFSTVACSTCSEHKNAVFRSRVDSQIFRYALILSSLSIRRLLAEQKSAKRAKRKCWCLYTDHRAVRGRAALDGSCFGTLPKA